MFKKSNIPGDKTPKPAVKEATPNAVAPDTKAAPAAIKSEEPAKSDAAKS